MTFNKRLKSCSGRSMIEMLAVLAIVGILSAGGVWGYSQAMDAYRIQKVADDLRLMTVKAMLLFTVPPKETHTYNVTSLYNFGIVPKEYKGSKTALGGGATVEISVSEDTADFTGTFFDGNKMKIKGPKVSISFKFKGLTKTQCAKFMMTDWRNYPTVFTIANQSASNNSNRTKKPLTPAEANQLCVVDESGKVSLNVYSNFLYSSMCEGKNCK